MKLKKREREPMVLLVTKLIQRKPFLKVTTASKQQNTYKTFAFNVPKRF